MRIAIISDYYLDYLGGAQISMLSQKNALEAAGHEVFLLAPLKPPAKTTPEWLNTPAFRLKSLELPIFRNSKKTLTLLNDFFNAHKIDVVHVQTEFGLANAALRVAKELKIPTLHTVHTMYWQAPGKFQQPIAAAMRQLLKRFTGNSLYKMVSEGSGIERVLRDLTLNTANKADALISPSAHQLVDMKLAGLSTKSVVLTNPFPRIDETFPKPLPKAKARLAFVGRLVPEKRPIEFLNAAIEAQKSNDFELVIIGDGPLLDTAKDLAKETNFRFTGRLDSAQVQAEIDNSHAVVVASLGFDNQPMTIIEAISRHRGVFYVDPKLSPIVGDAGLISEPSISGMAAGLVELINESKLSALSKAAAKQAIQFSPETFVSGYEQLVSELSGRQSS